MNVLMLSWEFPPKLVGGLGRHVYELSRQLAGKGKQVHLITWGFPGAIESETIDDVQVYRAQGNFQTKSFLEFALSMNPKMVEIGFRVLRENRIDVIHAHDWMVAQTALELSKHQGVPLVSTIHSTEVGRGGVIKESYRSSIHELEQALVNYSDQIIVCSKYMRDQIRRIFGYRARATVIPNGIDYLSFDSKTDPGFRRQFAGDEEKIVLFVGRLVAEKGVSTLIEAASQVLQSRQDIRLIIVGEGPQRPELEKEALKIRHRVTFTGHVDDITLHSLFHVADLAVFPSLYEPFGIVALEAMVSKTPLIVSNVGGFSEIVNHRKTGIKVPSNSSDAIAREIIRILSNRKFAVKLANRAYRVALNRYKWENIAGRTVRVYKKALRELRIRKTPAAMRYTSRAISKAPSPQQVRQDHMEKGIPRIFSYYS